jgi:hypothetical protein
MLRKALVIGLFGLVMALLVMGDFGSVAAVKATAWDKDISNPGFVHGLAVEIDGEAYYFKGPGSIKGEIDVPGHTWVQAGKYQIVGKHYNVGPWMAAGAPWWVSGVDYGEQLFNVHGIIDVPPDELSNKKEMQYKKQGYIHDHEFVDSEGNELGDYRVYLKHIAVQEFYFDGGPMAPGSDHMVTPGVDYNFRLPT